MTASALHLRGRILVSQEGEVWDDVWSIDGRLSRTPPGPGVEVEEISGWVLPGLVDAHCHVGLEAEGGVDDARAREHAETDRAAGALLLRDAGSPIDSSWVHGEEDLPRLVRAGRHIARTKRYLRNFAREVEPEDLVDTVRQEARRGDGWVKLVGDWIERSVGDLAVCWPVDVLTEAIAAAHEEGARVTAHCFAEQSLRDFAAAGTDCIEHGPGLLPDTIATFAERGIGVVPTLVNIARFPIYAQQGEAKFPEYAAHMRDLHARRYETVGAAHDAGVPLFVGTDAGGQLPHGLVAREIAELTKAGLTPTEAISAGCWRARAWLGHPGIEEGASADVVVYPEDPREDIGVLTAPTAVVLRGRAF